MIAGEILPVRVRPWTHAIRAMLLRVLAPLPSLGVAWWLTEQPLPTMIWLGIIVYALAHLALRAADRQDFRHPSAAARSRLAMLVDLLFALLLLLQSDKIGIAIYPLYILISLRVLNDYQRLPAALLTPFLFGPAYLFSYHFSYYQGPTMPADQIAQWALLFGSIGLGSVAIWLSALQHYANARLRQELQAERNNRTARVGELERTTNDLRSRMRELHALEEGLRVITSTLSLDEVLDQIVESTVQVLGPTRIHAMTLSLQNEGVFDHRSWTSDGRADCPWAAPLAKRAMEQRVPMIISDTNVETELAKMLPAVIRSVLCVPLFIEEGQPKGALTVVSATPSAFGSVDARHITAFAIQAGIAIHNAELHDRLRQQQQLLEAVVRDMDDGLIVINAQQSIILANPLGHELLSNKATTPAIREQLLTLAANMRTENKVNMTCELRLSDDSEEPEVVYHAFGSKVRQQDGAEPLIAIVLHNISDQKAEERARSEFISMVSHELRNPLNSLNGFIKVVLQGRAGALTALQHEFLAIADQQVDRLKGRIAELLEYNRLDAGRLALNPQWNDLPLLVMSALARLRLQAEQSGLNLVNMVSDEMPEVYFDSERIGQVLTNLVENAMKATPPGGSIEVRSELHDAEVWVRICDTGVGIPNHEQPKIFQRFYRVHNRTSREGNHLGLGLAICQQIVEGHKGRIWVESEEGNGSCFTFSLPLVQREIAMTASGA